MGKVSVLPLDRDCHYGSSNLQIAGRLRGLNEGNILSSVEEELGSSLPCYPH